MCSNSGELPNLICSSGSSTNMNITIKTDMSEPILLTSIKEEPKSSDEEEDCVPPVAASAKVKLEAEESNNVELIAKKKKGIPGMRATELWNYLQTDIITFCQNLGLIARSVTCRCGHQMSLSYENRTSDGALWRCRKGLKHNASVTLRKGSWFENSRLTLGEILWIAYMWVHEYSYRSMLHESDNSTQTLEDWRTGCRDACRAILESKQDPLGGSINLVEVFECKFQRDKLNKKRKRSDKSRWVFCGVEQFSTKSVLVVVEDKNSNTICDILTKYIKPGTTVFGNIWNAYRFLKKEDFTYLTQERSLTFFDSVDQTEMDTVEDLWDVAERRLPSGNNCLKKEFGSEFCEYIYRKSLKFASDAYLEFLKDIAKIYTPHDRMDMVN